MNKKSSLDADFEAVEQNYKNYLAALMVTHLDVKGVGNKKQLITGYLSCIKDYHLLEKCYLDDAIRNQTLTEDAGRGAFTALLGVAISGVVFASVQKTPSMDVFGVKAGVQGGFSAVIGASSSALIYKAWSDSCEKPANADFNACQAEMEKAGFTNEKYKELSANLVKLFHFRECLLLGLQNQNKMNMRTEFKNAYYSAESVNQFNDTDFNIAVEVYFLEQLNELFHQAFQSIYKVHDSEIEKEKNQPEFLRWFKKHFQAEANQKKFTQEMQVQFMSECIRFLDKEMSEPGFMGSYPWLIDLVVGLIAASLAVSLAAVTVSFIPTFGLYGIAIGAAILGMVCTHLLVTGVDELYYKRDKENRDAINTVIQSVQSEQKRLSKLLQNVIETSNQDLDDLKKYDDEGESATLRWMGFQQDHPNAMGSSRAWMREYITRFRENKFVEIDLSNRLKSIRTDANTQNKSLQQVLIRLMAPSKDSPSDLTKLNTFIVDTKKYLEDPKNAEFIKKFQILQKVKEQILEVIAFVPLNNSIEAIPVILTDFYISLAGLASDVEQSRRMARIVADNVLVNSAHPYHRLLKAAHRITIKMNGAGAKEDFIFAGDNDYRKILGMPLNKHVAIEDKINIANIECYLNTSFDFLYSLNQYKIIVEWKASLYSSNEFLLYRMLLTKQLANLIDPKNSRVINLVKDKIKTFIQQKLKADADTALNSMLTQAFLVIPKIDNKIINDKLDHPHTITELSYIADAIRLDIAHTSHLLSHQNLIAFEATRFLMTGENKIILGHDSLVKLTAEFSKHFYKSIKDTLVTTNLFIEAIKIRPLLQQTGTINSFIQEVSAEIDRISGQINTLILPPLANSLDPQPLQEILVALANFKKTLPENVVTSVDCFDDDTYIEEEYPIPEPDNGASMSGKVVDAAENFVDGLHHFSEHVSRVFHPETERVPFVNTTLNSIAASLHNTGVLGIFSHKSEESVQAEGHPETSSEANGGENSVETMLPGSNDNKKAPVNLTEFINELEIYIQKKVGVTSSGCSFFKVSHHSNEDKLKAARALKSALENKSDQNSWEDEIYKTNPHMKTMINKYCGSVSLGTFITTL